MLVSDTAVSRPCLIRDASFLETDRREIALRRGRHNRLGFAYPVNACSCLTLILACIVYRQAREISPIAAAPDFPFDPDLLPHVSPIEWNNVILYGEIKIDPAKLKLRVPWRVFLHELGRYPTLQQWGGGRRRLSHE